MANLDTAAMTVADIQYLIIPGQYDVDKLPLDQLIPTNDSDTPNTMRINVYDDGATYYINGVAKIITPNIYLNKATIHIIDTPIILSPACPATDLTCSHPLSWVDTTIANDLSADTYSIFAGLVSKSSVKFTDPYTIFVISNDAFNIHGTDLVDYLNFNTTALDEYIKKLYTEGTIFPNVAAQGDTNVATADGSVYVFTRASDTSVLIDNLFVANAIVRDDGIYYICPDFLFDTEIPAGPVPVGPAPTAPIPDPITPGSSASRLNAVWVCLFFVVAVLFL